MFQNNLERIKCSAIKVSCSDYFHIFTGKRHADIFEFMFNHNIKYDKDTHIQGFLTNEDRFVDRYEASLIAFDANQISDPNITCLYSEDIWPEE
jgi:hypothetical protein